MSTRPRTRLGRATRPAVALAYVASGCAAGLAPVGCTEPQALVPGPTRSTDGGVTTGGGTPREAPQLQAVDEAEPDVPDVPDDVDPALEAPGPAYLAIEGKGVVVLQDGRFVSVAGAPDEPVQQMTVGADGRAYLLAAGRVMALQGAKATLVAPASEAQLGPVTAFAVGKGADVWTVGPERTGRYVRGGWETVDTAAFGADAQPLAGIAADRDGRVWVATATALYASIPSAGDGAPAGWRAVDLGPALPGPPKVIGIAAEPGVGAVVAATQTAAFRLSGPHAAEALDVPAGAPAPFGRLSTGTTGIVALARGPGAIVRLELDRAGTVHTMGVDYPGTRLLALGADGRGRIWAGTDIGISILGPEDERVHWPMGSVAELAGRIRGIVVVDGGPDLPEVGAPKTGGLAGTIFVGHTPLGRADIEICPEPATLIHASPCERSPTRFTGRTAENGRFAFSNVPIGVYGVAVKVGEAWRITFPGRYGARMREGSNFDIGKLKF